MSEVDFDQLLKLLWPTGEMPGNMKNNPELYNFLDKLSTFKLNNLKREQAAFTEKTKNIVEQTQNLAISNYKTFIHTSENTRSIFDEFENAEMQVDALIEKLPQFAEQCDTFLSESAEINEKRRLNSITLRKNALLLEILELPQLMERCIREGRYEEALELVSYVRKMGQKQGHIPIIKTIVTSVETLWHTMLVQLLVQLRSDLQLPKCLQIVGYLRRMQAFSNNELKLKFLQARDFWLNVSLKAIPTHDVQQHLTKTIEVTRINLFNIITQYRAIFPDDDIATSQLGTSSPSFAKPLQGVSCDGDRLFYAWLHRKIDEFLITLESDLARGVHSFDTLLGQCMYFGLSFSRIGADFRCSMVPIFVRVIRQNFEKSIAHVNENYEHELEKYTVINKVNLHKRNKIDLPSASGTNEPIDQATLTPPETLLNFHPLATLCNGYLNALNELRLCTPIALAKSVTHCMQLSLEFVANKLLGFYHQEKQAFTSKERETFAKLCSCFAYDLVPYVQRCVHAIFPQQTLSNHLGINLLMLEQERITYLKQAEILEPLKHLLPQRVETLT